MFLVVRVLCIQPAEFVPLLVCSPVVGHAVASVVNRRQFICGCRYAAFRRYLRSAWVAATRALSAVVSVLWAIGSRPSGKYHNIHLTCSMGVSLVIFWAYRGCL